MNRVIPAIAAILAALVAPGIAIAQTAPAPQETAVETIDIFDVWRAFRDKNDTAEEAVWDYRKSMKAFAPVIGVKPSSGALLGVAGNIAFYRGDPATTRISSVVASLTLSSKGQTAITDRFTVFTRDDRWKLEADHRFQWTSLETHALGTSADTSDGVLANFDFFRLHHTAYYQLRPGLYAGGGLYFDTHINIGPDDPDDPEALLEWAASPFMTYTAQHGLPADSQASAGPSVDLLWDTRDSFINAAHGWLAKASYRMSLDGFLGADSSWQRINLDVRTYRPVSSSGRHTIAGWMFADLIVGGVAPYLDLPGTGLDTYGRSARGYSEGQFRGERMAYGEVEYRATLMRNGLVGMVTFLNATTVSNFAQHERLFDSLAIGAGAGLRLLINKRSKTNLCFDVGIGKQGSKGIYLAIQEAF